LSRRAQLSIEPLEDRAQPAHLTFATASIFSGLGLQLGGDSNHGQGSDTTDVSFVAMSSPHTVFIITFHISVLNSPSDTPSSSGSDSSTQGATPTPTDSASPVKPTASPTSLPAVDPDFVVTPTSNATVSAAQASSGNAISSLLSTRSAAQQSLTTTIPTVAHSSVTSLLPPDATTSSTASVASSANRADSLAIRGVQEGGTAFQPAPIQYYIYGDSPTFTARDPQFTMPAARVAGENLKIDSPMALPQAPQPQRVTDAPAEIALPELVLPIVVDTSAATPATEVVIPSAFVMPVEETTSPWAWAAMGVVGVAGVSWALHSYWLKAKLDAARQPDNWRRDLLGFDFDQA
jgi:hypothetical protein